MLAVQSEEWPNVHGFTATYEQREPVELTYTGIIPAYAAGVLFRTGTGPRNLYRDGEFVFRGNHWFDGFAQIHRFEICRPDDSGGRVRVFYNSRLTSDALIERVRETGRLDGITFAAKYDPCKTLFQKLQSWFTPLTDVLFPSLPKPGDVNIGVTLSVNLPGLSVDGKPAPISQDESEIVSLCAKTDASVIQMLDSDTLNPIGTAKQEVLHPDLKGPLSCAHEARDSATGDIYNFNLQLGGPQGIYRVFRTCASTGNTVILATFKHNPAYLHSFFLTEHYVVICAWNSYFTAGGLSVVFNQNVVDSLEYKEDEQARWFVIDRLSEDEGGKGVLVKYDSPSFFAFHSINAYEQLTVDGKVDIIADIPVYRNLDIFKRFYYDNLLSDSPKYERVQREKVDSMTPSYRRYQLSNIPSDVQIDVRSATLVFELDRGKNLELPTLNPNFSTKRHRFVYGLYDSGKSTLTDGLVKLDLEDLSVKRWTTHGHTAGEAIFVADPESDSEDGGVLLSVVLDGIEGKSYLLVLDARDLSELAKVQVEGAIGFGFHGVHTQLIPSRSISAI